MEISVKEIQDLISKMDPDTIIKIDTSCANTGQDLPIVDVKLRQSENGITLVIQTSKVALLSRLAAI